MTRVHKMLLLVCVVLTLLLPACGSGQRYCPRCNGEGRVNVKYHGPFGDPFTGASCPVCNGSGKVPAA